MKRLIYGVAVIALLAVGAGLLANLGGAQVASHAATAGYPRSGPPGHTPRRPEAVSTPQVPWAHQPAGGTAAPRAHRRVTAAPHSTATRHTPVLAALHAVRHVPADTVAVVDPASVALPPTGSLLLLNPNTAAPGATINV